MMRRHRRCHRLAWPVIIVVVGIAFAAAIAARSSGFEPSPELVR
jgi:hypothetical protein